MNLGLYGLWLEYFWLLQFSSSAHFIIHKSCAFNKERDGEVSETGGIFWMTMRSRKAVIIGLSQSLASLSSSVVVNHRKLFLLLQISTRICCATCHHVGRILQITHRCQCQTHTQAEFLCRMRCDRFREIKSQTSQNRSWGRFDDNLRKRWRFKNTSRDLLIQFKRAGELGAMSTMSHEKSIKSSIEIGIESISGSRSTATLIFTLTK